jgi:hypothetical protein
MLGPMNRGFQINTIAWMWNKGVHSKCGPGMAAPPGTMHPFRGIQQTKLIHFCVTLRKK